MGVIHWLVDQGAVRDAVAFAVGLGCARLVGLTRQVRRLLRKQDEIINLLDTRTPGGLSDLLEAYERALEPDRRARR